MLVAPQPGGGISHATTALDTRHGRVEVSWRVEDGRLAVETSLPEGVTGVLRLPGRPDTDIASGMSSHDLENERP